MMDMTKTDRFGRTWRAAAIALAVAGLAPAVQADPVQLGVLDGPAPPIATEAQARVALAHNGLKDVTQLAAVGDYWEANARERGKPVVVYLFSDGTLRIDRTPSVMVQMGGRAGGS